MKSVNVLCIIILIFMWKIMVKIVNLKVVIMLEYENKNIFAKGYTPNWFEVVVI